MEYVRYRFLYPGYEGFKSVSKPSSGRKGKKLAICLDLDETLVRTFQDERQPDDLTHEYRERAYDCDKHNMWGLKRPYLNEFLRFCRKNFSPFIIWTAGNKEYADYIVETIFTEGFMPDYVYHYDHCTTYNRTYIKDLNRIYTEWNLSPSQLLMIDNNADVFTPLDKYNLVNIPDYMPDIYDDDNDICLKELIEWLKGVKRSRYDVQNISKRNIFERCVNEMCFAY